MFVVIVQTLLIRYMFNNICIDLNNILKNIMRTNICYFLMANTI